MERIRDPPNQLPQGFIINYVNVIPLLAGSLPDDLFFVVQVSLIYLFSQAKEAAFFRFDGFDGFDTAWF